MTVSKNCSLIFILYKIGVSKNARFLILVKLWLYIPLVKQTLLNYKLHHNLVTHSQCVTDIGVIMTATFIFTSIVTKYFLKARKSQV